MRYETITFSLLVVVCCALALMTSHVIVRWILPRRLTAELGNGSRYVAIDGIRGYLAFGVCFHHSLVTWIYLETNKWIAPPHHFEFEIGRGSVAVFFMISAFLFWGRVSTKKTLDIQAFLVSRLFRIYPLYFFVLTIIGTAVAWKTHWTRVESFGSIANEIAKWLVFLEPNINGYKDTGNVVAGVTWSLQYEAWFYLALPLLLIILLQRRSIWQKLIALAIVCAAFRLFGLNTHIAATFLGGILAVYWRSSPRLILWANSSVGSLVALISISCVLLFRSDPFSAASIILLTVFFVCVASGNTIFGVLTMQGSLWLGEISYSIYLLHGIVLWIVMQNILPQIHGFIFTPHWFAISMLSTTLIVLSVSTITHVFLERPFIEWGHQLAK
jgi:peptidoglycan/LPS O-acetylase OafA/YrhL